MPPEWLRPLLLVLTIGLDLLMWGILLGWLRRYGFNVRQVREALPTVVLVNIVVIVVFVHMIVIIAVFSLLAGVFHA